MKYLFSPLYGLFRWKYVLTPLALPLIATDNILQRHALVFGVKIAAWTPLLKLTADHPLRDKE